MTGAPRARAVAERGGAESPGRWVACGNGDDSLLTLPVKIRGIETRAVLDSGATRSAVDAGFAARHRLHGVRDHRITALTRETVTSVTGPLYIEASARHLLTTSALILDLAPMARAARMPIELVLGHEFFVRNMVEIDPDRAALRFWTNGSDDINHWLPVVQTADGLFCTTILPKEGLEAAAIIDLGCSTPLYVSPEFAEANNLFGGKRRGSSASLGIEGVAISQLGRLGSLRLGDLILHDVPFAVPPVWRFAAPMIMGLPLLMRFRCQLAFGRARMQLVRASGSNRPFMRDASGLSVLHAGDHLQVIHVAKHSPAARAGLHEGDSIVAINDEQVGPGNAPNHRNLGKRPPGTRYALSMLAKGDLELVLEDYY